MLHQYQLGKISIIILTNVNKKEIYMQHETIFVLLPKEKAENSFEARRLVVLEIEKNIKSFNNPPYPKIGGDY